MDRLFGVCVCVCASVSGLCAVMNSVGRVRVCDCVVNGRRCMYGAVYVVRSIRPVSRNVFTHRGKFVLVARVYRIA